MSFYPLIFCRLRKQPTPYPNFPLIKCLPRAVTTTEIRGSKETGRGHGIRLHHCAVMIQTHTILLTTTWRKQERVLNYLKQSPCNMTSDERVQKFHTDDVSLPHIWVVLLIGWKICFIHSETLPRSDASSVWNFTVRFSDVISWWYHWWRSEMSAVFSG